MSLVRSGMAEFRTRPGCTQASFVLRPGCICPAFVVARDRARLLAGGAWKTSARNKMETWPGPVIRLEETISREEDTVS